MAGYYSISWSSMCLSVCPSVVHPSVHISFPDDKLDKCQWIFIKLGVYIDIVEIWFGIANGQISSIFDTACNTVMVGVFLQLTLVIST